MSEISPAEKVQNSLRNYGIGIHFCLGVIFGAFVSTIITNEGRIISILGVIAFIVWYLLTLSSARMLQKSVTVTAHPTEPKETHV